MGHDWPMRRRRKLARFADFAIPWGVGLFLVLVVFDEADKHDDPSAVLVAGLAIVVVQAIALRWRRRQPERVMALVLVTGLAFQLLYPSVVLPIPALFAVGSLAAARPPAVSLVGLAGVVALSATNFFTTTVEDTVSRWVSPSAPGPSARRPATAAWPSRRNPSAPWRTSRPASPASCTT